MIPIETVEDYVDDFKGHVSLHYSYHSSGWIADYSDKRDKLIFQTSDEMGEGVFTVEGAIELLAKKMKGKYE